jgi:hypothetical protein
VLRAAKGVLAAAGRFVDLRDRPSIHRHIAKEAGRAMYLWHCRFP